MRWIRSNLRLLGVCLFLMLGWMVSAAYAFPPTVTVQFTESNVFVAEGPGAVVVFTVRLSEVAAEAVTVQWAASNGSATSPGDYTAASGTVVFASGDTQKQIQVSIANDSTGEPVETAWVKLSNPQNADLGAIKEATFTIIDDDNPPPTVHWNAATYPATEGAASLIVQASLSAMAHTTVTVKYSTGNATPLEAKADSDYTATSGTLSFALGETSKTVEIPITNDSIFEPSEKFIVQLSDPTGATLGTQSTATITITDNDTLSIAASAGSPAPSAVVVGGQTQIQLTASANIEPSGQNPSWAWSYSVEYAETPGQFGPPPPDAGFTINIDPPPTTNPSVTQMKATFSKAGYWRISNLQASVSYLAQFGTGLANHVEVTVVKVALAPSTAYVQEGGTAGLVATVTPPEAASLVSFVSQDPTIVSTTGGAPDVTLFGLAAGSTHVQAKVGSQVAASTEVRVLLISFWPQAGPIFTRIDISMGPGSNFLSANTTIAVNGVFTAETFAPEPFAITLGTSKLKYGSANPDQISLAVADVYPSSFLSSSNPAIQSSLPGMVNASVTLIDGAKQCSLQVAFSVTAAGSFGKLVDGSFQELQTGLQNSSRYRRLSN